MSMILGPGVNASHDLTSPSHMARGGDVERSISRRGKSQMLSGLGSLRDTKVITGRKRGRDGVAVFSLEAHRQPLFHRTQFQPPNTGSISPQVHLFLEKVE